INIMLVCAAGLVAWLLVAFVRKPLVCLGGLVAITAGDLVTARVLYDNKGVLLLPIPGAFWLVLSGLFFLRFLYFLACVGEIAHPADARTLRLEKSGQRNS